MNSKNYQNNKKIPKIVLTIAGSDPSGGAGLQVDLKTFAAHGCYGCAVVTALTAQNPLGVTGIHVPPLAFFVEQLQRVLAYFPQPDAVKIGMLPNADVVEATAVCLAPLSVPIVVDPVLVATSGSVLAGDDTAAAIRARLFPIATLITPNRPETQVFTGCPLRSEEEIQRAAEQLQVPCLIKGGHAETETEMLQEQALASDFLFLPGQGGQEARREWLRAPRVPGQGVHGTGCTLSSAIACHLAEGESVFQSVRAAKTWLTEQLQTRPWDTPNAPLFF